MAVFSPVGSSTLSGSVTIQGATTRQTSILALTLANTEYAVALPAGTKQYIIKLRDGAAAFQIKETSGGDYLTVPRYCFIGEDNLTLAATLTLYLQSPVAGQTAEIITWS